VQGHPCSERLLLIGDIHSGLTDSPPRQANTQALSALDNLVDHLQDYPFSLLVQMGDMIRETENKSTNTALYSQCLNVLCRLPFSAIHLLGNHDLYGISRDNLHQIFQQYGLNPFYGVREYNDFQVLWLDLVAPPDGSGTLPEATIAWLENTVYPDTPTFIFSHYGIMPQNSEGNFYFHGARRLTALANNREVWQALSGLPVQAVISAHMHWGSYSKVGNTHLITIPAFIENAASPDSDNCPGIYSVLEITDPHRFTLKSYFGSNCLLNIEADS